MILQPQIVTQNDYGYQLPFTLEDGNGNVLNLTGASLTFKVQAAQDPTNTLTVNAGMTVDSPTGGTCHYTVSNGDFPTPGSFIAQIVVTYASEVVSYSGITIIVQPALPKANN